MTTDIKYYYDLLSQPCRALYIFFKLNPQLKTEYNAVDLRKGEQLTAEFRDNINRFKKVPCIIDVKRGGFKLSESVAIFRYICETKSVDWSWYPKGNIDQRAAIDEFLEWQHIGIRVGCSLYFRKTVIEPMLFGKTPSDIEVAMAKGIMESGLDTFEKIWLKDVDTYLFGNKISFADLIAACEIEQPRVAGYDPTEGRPNLAKWLELVRRTEYYAEASVTITQLMQQNKKL